MTKTQRAEASPEIVVLVVGVPALILTLTLGPGGFTLGAILIALVAFGLVKQHKAKAVPTAPTPRLVPLTATDPVDVVGESHYQPALARFAGRQATAVLVPEPTNAHDGNAVRVDLLQADGTPSTVGYLARADARRHQPALLELTRRGAVASCPAHVSSGSRGMYGVTLHTATTRKPTTASVTPAANRTPRSTTLPAEHPVTVTGEEQYQDVLARLAPAPPKNVVAELRDCVITKGTHKGEHTLEVLVDGEPVGRLTHAMGQRYGRIAAEWRARTGQASCEAVVAREGTRGLQITVLLPR